MMLVKQHENMPNNSNRYLPNTLYKTQLQMCQNLNINLGTVNFIVVKVGNILELIVIGYFLNRIQRH